MPDRSCCFVQLLWCVMLCWVHALYFMLKHLHDPGMPVVIVPEPISTQKSQNKQLAKCVAHEAHVPAATTTQATASFFCAWPPFGGCSGMFLLVLGGCIRWRVGCHGAALGSVRTSACKTSWRPSSTLESLEEVIEANDFGRDGFHSEGRDPRSIFKLCDTCRSSFTSAPSCPVMSSSMFLGRRGCQSCSWVKASFCGWKPGSMLCVSLTWATSASGSLQLNSSDPESSTSAAFWPLRFPRRRRRRFFLTSAVSISGSTIFSKTSWRASWVQGSGPWKASTLAAPADAWFSAISCCPWGIAESTST